MTRTEIKLNGYRKELEKLNTQLERAEMKLEKKLTTAQKFGVDEWDNDKHNKWLRTVPKAKNGCIINSQDVKKNGAWFDLYSARSEVEDIKGRIERKTKVIGKIANQYEAELEAVATTEAENARADMADRYMSIAFTKEEIERMQEQMREEWRRDGIEITEFGSNSLTGTTPKGLRFHFTINSGMTERSWHCYTLYIQGLGTIFTSGTVASCYKAIKRN